MSLYGVPNSYTFGLSCTTKRPAPHGISAHHYFPPPPTLRAAPPHSQAEAATPGASEATTITCSMGSPLLRLRKLPSLGCNPLPWEGRDLGRPREANVAPGAEGAHAHASLQKLEVRLHRPAAV